MTEKHPSTAESFDARHYYEDDGVAADYERVRFGGLKGSVVYALERRLLLKALRMAGNINTVLDLPVGTGRLVEPLQQAGYEVLGADTSAAMLRHANARLKDNVALMRADGGALPLQDNSIDVVVCFRLLPHLPAEARQDLLKEMARVARVAIVAVYQPHRLSAWHFVRNRLQGKRLPRHYIPASELTSEFAKCGLEVRGSLGLLPGILMERAYVLRPAH